MPLVEPVTKRAQAGQLPSWRRAGRAEAEKVREQVGDAALENRMDQSGRDLG